MWISASFSRVDTKNPTGVYGSQIPLLRRRPAGDKRMIRLLFAVGPVCQQDVGGEALHILSIYRSSLFILSCSRAGSASHHQLTPQNLHTTAGLVFRLLLKLQQQKKSNYQFSPLFAAKTAKKKSSNYYLGLCLQLKLHTEGCLQHKLQKTSWNNKFSPLFAAKTDNLHLDFPYVWKGTKKRGGGLRGLSQHLAEGSCGHRPLVTSQAVTYRWRV